MFCVEDFADLVSLFDMVLCSIQTWALEEARRRLEAEGILPEPAAKK